jgi:pyruvate/2-oxoglutarate dehydrogenase complex dihydrolipoamide dehydrogenase (E3) component
MTEPEQHDVLTFRSGRGGKLLARQMARSGRRTAVAERRWMSGSSSNSAHLPSKDGIWSAGVAHLMHDAGQYGTVTGAVDTEMVVVHQRTSDTVSRHRRAAAMTERLGRLSSNVSPREASLKGRSV